MNDIGGFTIGVLIALPTIAVLILVTRRWWQGPDDPAQHKPNGKTGRIG